MAYASGFAPRHLKKESIGDLYDNNDMNRPVEEREIVASLSSANCRYVRITDLSAYAKKAIHLGASFSTRDETGRLLSYVLYYDNSPTVFVTMVWTHPQFQRRGLAKQLLENLLRRCGKNVRLEVHRHNPARRLYETLGFEKIDERDEILVMEAKALPRDIAGSADDLA